VLALLAGEAAVAANGLLSSQGKLGTQVNELPFPGPGRVIFGLLVTVGLAIAAVLLLRRFWPTLGDRRTTGGRIRLLDRSVVSATLTLSLVEVEGSRFLVAEGKGGVGMTPVAVSRPPAGDSL
jgi:hypothetical protein